MAASILKSQSIFGNASSLHTRGQEAKKLLEDSRKKIAKIIGASSSEIVFTPSGTESVNLAILGIARAYKKQGTHIITSKIEHLSVLKACEYLEKKEGFKISYLDVQPNGVIDPELIKKSLRPDTVLTSIMYANNEIGTIQPIAKISKVIRNFRKFKIANLKLKINEKLPVFHVDACQAAGALELNVQKLGVDLMTLNGSKIYGPKGTGCLFVRRGTDIEPMIVGGSQEMGRRAGTENVPLLAGFAMALEQVDKNRVKESARLTKLRDNLIDHLLQNFQGRALKISLNGDPILRLPNNINISFSNDNTSVWPHKSIVDPIRARGRQGRPTSDGVSGEMMVLALDRKGIEVSTGSACTSAYTGQSHVLKVLFEAQLRTVKTTVNSGNLRITLGRSTTKKDLDYFLKVLLGIIAKLR